MFIRRNKYLGDDDEIGDSFSDDLESVMADLNCK